MKILPNIIDMNCSRLAELKDNYTLVTFNESKEVALSYKETDKSNFDILSDLIECKAYATALLYLNENYILSDKHSGLLEDKNINEFYEDCEELLTKNIKIVEEAGIPLTDINGYKIFEGQGYILRGNGKKKIRESFNERGEIELEDITLDYLKNRKYDAEIIGMSKCPKCNYIFDNEINTFDRDDGEYMECPHCSLIRKKDDFPWAWVDDLYDAPNANDLVPGINEDLNEEAEGTQTTDIAPKVDQELGINKPKKKYEDVLLSDINENEEILNKGFMKNLDGFYQRGNYILVKEGDKYLAIHKDKLK